MQEIYTKVKRKIHVVEKVNLIQNAYLKEQSLKQTPGVAWNAWLIILTLYFGCLLECTDFIRDYNLELFSCTTSIFVTDTNWRSKADKNHLPFIHYQWFFEESNCLQKPLVGWMSVVKNYLNMYNKQWKEINGSIFFLDVVETPLNSCQKTWIPVLVLPQTISVDLLK